MKNLLTWALVVSLSAPLLAQTKGIQHNQLKRRYIVYTPKGYNAASETGYPVVFNFHGSGMTPAEQMLYTDFNRTADKYGFIAVYPKGINDDWNVGFGISYKSGTDDVGFTEAILNQVEKDFRVNSSKVFATGLSRGGFFCHRIAAELPHRFSAIAAVGAPLPDSVAHYHPAKKDVGVLIVQGKADKVVNAEGKKGGYFSALNTYKYWLGGSDDAVAAGKLSRIDADKHDGTSVEIMEARQGKKSVVLMLIENGGHTWPGADDFNVGLPIGITSKEIKINEYMWEFFSRQ